MSKRTIQTTEKHDKYVNKIKNYQNTSFCHETEYQLQQAINYETTVIVYECWTYYRASEYESILRSAGNRINTPNGIKIILKSI